MKEDVASRKMRELSRRSFGRACLGGAALAPLLLRTGRLRAEELRGAIRFSWWGGPARNAKTNAVCDLFETKYPGIKITREIADWQPYWDKLSVQSAGHNQPQAVQMQSRYIDQYANGGALRALDDLVQAGLIDLSGIAAPALATGRQPDGKMYMAPYGIFTLTSMFNKTMMEQVGVSPPRFEWTWDDFVAITKAAAKRLPRGTYATALLGGEIEPFYPWVIGHGEALFTDQGLGLSKPTLIAWYQMWEDLRKSQVSYSADMMSEVQRSSIENAPIALGKVMMDVKPANQLQAHQDVIAKLGKYTLDIQKQPSGPKGPGEMVGCNGISIGGDANEQDAKVAATFINFFLRDPAGAKMFASDNGVVSVKSLQDAQLADPTTSYGTRRQIELLQRVLTIARPEVYPHYYQALLALLQRNYQAVAFESLSIEKAADQFFIEAGKLAKA
jgi:multiple sugar transport system substrate-binding protein